MYAKKTQKDHGEERRGAVDADSILFLFLTISTDLI